MVHTLPAAGNLVDRPTDLLRLIGTTAANALETGYKRKSRRVVANDAASSKHALQAEDIIPNRVDVSLGLLGLWQTGVKSDVT
jgi:hypothetical protein